MSFARLFFILILTSPIAGFGQSVPEWIWHPGAGASPGANEVRYFRKTFSLDELPRRANLGVAADNHFVAYLNGQKIGEATGWNEFRRYDVAKNLKRGQNVLAIEARNEGGPAGLIAQLELRGQGDRQMIVSDASWKTSAGQERDWPTAAFQPGATWLAAKSLGKLGVSPWGNIAATAGARREQVSGGKPATPAESITVLDGFKVELLRSSQAGEGSWVAMAADSKGRLIISPQGKEPMLRVTLDDRGQIAGIEKLDVPISGAMGLLYAFDALYVNGQGPQGYHLYRVRETSDGKFGEPELLRKWKGGPGEHGAHGIVLGPDNKLYIVNGNFVDVPEDILPTSPHKNYADDQILPRMEDGNGFGAGRKPPGGYVVRLDKDGKNAELFASGQRNTYDIAFNADGELFGFDSDMEWDWGSPWYRPTRAYHIVSGADHGFREGSAKWPTYYEDSLPEVVDIGIGSPTGVLVPAEAKFPDKFRKSVLMMDWSYGRIVAVHLKPNGASYTGTFDTLVKGKPLNVTDMEVGPDGALYFATGGRGTQSGLYRVSYTGSDARPGTVLAEPAGAAARQLRRSIEAFHGRQDPRAVSTAWPHLRSDDRSIRYAARLAIEAQPVSEWKDKARAELNPNAALTALLALARVGSSTDQADVFAALAKFPTAGLPEKQQLLKLRVIEVSIARHGRPSLEVVQRGIEKLSPLYPAKSFPLNRELSQILIYLDAPGVVGKTLDLVGRAETQEEQLHYIVALRKAKSWSIDERKRYLSWFQNRSAGQDAGPTYPAGGNYYINASTRHPAAFEKWFSDVGIKAGNGASYNNFIKKLKTEILAGLSDSERAELGPLLLDAQPIARRAPQKQRQFVREWKLADFADSLNGPSRGRSFESGREAFAAAQCAQCHRFANEGGAVGPDLSGAGSKYSRRDLLESILDSSRVISDQYQNTTVLKRDGDDVTGRVIEDTDTKLVLVINPLTGDKVDVRKADIQSRAASKTSPMPDGLVNILTKEEILDLLAYLESAGNREHAAFKR
jgi:putative heme-binding domain-containing protein